ncbi:MAG: protein translocase subunit SecD [Nocardioides sp.]
MAKKQQRPGRTLIVFFLGVAISFGLVALTGTWAPQLGLDLEGGTRITLQAKGNPSQENLDEARDIIDNRVNGSGVAEAAVSTQGGGIISVEIPGDQRRDLIDTVERQAQLRFRLVACSDVSPCIAQGNGGADPSQVTPEVEIPTTKAPATKAPATKKTSKGTPRVAPGFATDGEKTPAPKATPAPQGSPSDSPSESPGDDPSGDPSGESSESPDDEATATEDFDNAAVGDLDEELAFIRGGYTQADVDLFNAYACDDQGALLDAATGEPANLPDDPLKPLVACSPPEEGTSTTDPGQPSFKYLLSKAIIQGTDLDDAGYGIPDGQLGYAVTLDIGGKGREVFAAASGPEGLVLDQEQFAIVLDGQVISAPTFQGRIPDGSAQISGNFTETQAESLSTSLKYGALPISFEEPSSDTIGPSLAGDQLRAGLTAGAIGLALVMIYCLFYYRGLGLVVVASLGVAGAITYAMVLLLSETAGFTLTLPGVAGLIIAVGITADSFIILFERIRDEMRDGKSMRVAVESGWARARNTCLAADAVSLIAAVVLYISASGVVKGFAFALGLTTLIDLVVFFFFTKPLVSYLARFTFFNKGHRLSGLSEATLGTDARPVPAGSRA